MGDVSTQINNREEIRDDVFFNVVMNLWFLQNLFMTIAVILIFALGDSNAELGSQALIFSMYADTVVMIGFTVWGIFAIFRWKNYGGLLVTLGALAFLAFSTSYRALLDLYPDFGHVQIVVDLFNLESPNLDPNQPFDSLFDELSKVVNLLLYANGALAIFCIGLSFFVKRRRLKNGIIVFGLMNLLIAAVPLIVILKPIVSILLLLPFHRGLYRDKYPF